MTYLVGKCLLQKHLDNNLMTQTDLADRLGVTKQQINKYIHNRQVMSYAVAYNISVILNCDMRDLYDWEHAGTNE